MKNVKKVMVLFLLIVAIYFIQFVLINENSLFGIKPNLILVMVIIISLQYEIYVCTIYGFFSGFIMDSLYNSYDGFGYYTLIYTLVAIFIFCIRKKYLKDNNISLIYLIIIGTVFFETFEFFYYIFKYSATIKLSRLIFGTILAIIFNSGLGIMIYSIISKLKIKDTKSVYFR